jgi:alpha-tubulin suppressor-like RCC1 family protein
MVRHSIATSSRLCAAVALVVLGMSAVLQVTGATAAAAAGTADAIFSWGTAPAPVALPVGVTPIAVARGFANSYAIGSDGKLYAWGPNTDGSLGIGPVATDGTVPVVISLPAGVTPKAVAGGPSDGYAIGSDGNVYAWGFNGQGELGIGNNTGPEACSINGFQQPGPTVACATTPVRVALPTGTTATAIATSGAPQPGAAYAIGSDGKLYAWGNGQGELGDGTTNERDAPVVVQLPTGVAAKAVAGGALDGYAIGSDGNLYAWGDNEFGQLGNGTLTSSDVPVLVSLPPGVTAQAIAGGSGGGSGFAFLLGSDGNVYAWGFNGQADLGVGTATGPDLCPIEFVGGAIVDYPCSTTPVRVSLPSGVTATAISGYGDGGTAIGSDHHVYAWGDGGLGNGSSGQSATPVVVSLPPGSVPAELGKGASSIVNTAIVTAPDFAPSITTQPTSQIVTAGQDASFTAAASGFPGPTVQWQVSTDGGVSFSPVSGATSDTLTIASATVADNGNQYRAVFTNGVSPDAVTNPATLSVSPDVAPSITTDPLSQIVYSGQTETLTVGASGEPTPTIDWQISVDGGATWISLGALTGDTVTSGVLTAFENGWEARAVFTNLAGTATTTATTVSVLADIAPTVTTQPLSQSVLSGQTETLTVGASGEPTPTIDWQISVDGGATWISLGALTGDTVTSGVLTAFENGWEARAVFTNGGGSVATNAVTLTVT